MINRTYRLQHLISCGKRNSSIWSDPGVEWGNGGRSQGPRSRTREYYGGGCEVVWLLGSEVSSFDKPVSPWQPFRAHVASDATSIDVERDEPSSGDGDSSPPWHGTFPVIWFELDTPLHIGIETARDYSASVGFVPWWWSEVSSTTPSASWIEIHSTLPSRKF